MSFELRTYSFIDSYQPQLAQYIAKDNRVYDPAVYDSALFLEIHPAMEIHAMIDLALKATRVRLGVVITERHFGQLEVHHSQQGEVLAAGEAILKATGLSIEDKSKCKISTDKIIRGIEPDHAIAFTGMGPGNMIIPGESVLIMECEPAAYMAYICNQGLKAANVRLNLITTWGASGRLIIAGSEAEVDFVAKAAREAAQELA